MRLSVYNYKGNLYQRFYSSRGVETVGLGYCGIHMVVL